MTSTLLNSIGLTGVVQDASYGFRQLKRAPTFAAAAILSLAFGIAVNSTTFSIVSALLLRPIGTPGRGDFVIIGRSMNNDGSFRSVTRAEMLYLRQHASTLSHIFGGAIEPFTVGAPDGAQVVSGVAVTGNYFSALQVPITRGRGFTEEDDRPGQAAVAVLSDRFWRQRFASDPEILGRQVRVNTHPFTVVGVAPPEFHSLLPGTYTDIWIPSMALGLTRPPNRSSEVPTLGLMAQLKPGVSIAQARAEIEGLSAQMTRDNPTRGRERGFSVAPGRGTHPAFTQILRVVLGLLMAVVGIVLLIACANVAGLLLARAANRKSEISIRLAIGAGRSRVIRQLFVESLLLATGGAVLGLAIALFAIRAINTMTFPSGPLGEIFLDLRLDVRVVVFTVLASILSAVVFGLAPAFHATRLDLTSGLKDIPSLSGGRRSRLRGMLVFGQVALSTILLVTGVLLTRSLWSASTMDLRFNPDPVVIGTFDLLLPGYDNVKIAAFYEDLLRQTRSLSGVEHAALATAIPMENRRISSTRISISATPPREEEIDEGDSSGVPFIRITDAYFSTLQQPLLLGRDFTTADLTEFSNIIIVNTAMAQKFWPDMTALGKRIWLMGEKTQREVVGVVTDARWSFGGELQPMMYLPTSRNYSAAMRLHVRTSGGLAGILPALTRIVRNIDENVPTSNIVPMRESLASSLDGLAIMRGALGISGVLALLLACFGLYALVSYTFARSIREIGIRVALGANRVQVFCQIGGGALKFASIGMIAGLAIAAGVMHLLRAFLYGVSPTDPISLAVVAGLLLAVILLAGYGAARRALNIDPAVALRHD
jgi:predicted permease